MNTLVRSFRLSLATVALSFLAGYLALPAWAAEKRPLPSSTGLLLTPGIFKPVTLARSFQNDKIRDALAYGDHDLVRVVDLDLNDDLKPERFIVAAEKLCAAEGCPYTLLDGKSLREIGQFVGTLIVLKQHKNGWAVIQTVGRNDAGLFNLSTYAFNRAQYQPEDSALIDEVTFEALLQTLSRLP